MSQEYTRGNGLYWILSHLGFKDNPTIKGNQLTYFFEIIFFSPLGVWKFRYLYITTRRYKNPFELQKG